MFKQRVKHYHQWLRSSIHLKTKFSQSPSDSVRLQDPSKELALTSCIQSLLSKNAIERVENVKSLGFYSRLFLVPKPHQRWSPVIDLSRLNTFLHVERFKMETPESITASLIPGNQVGMKKVYTFPRLPIWGANTIRCLHCFLEIKGFPGMNYKKKPQTSVSQIDGPMNSYVYTLLL